ncbi:MAG: MoaD/ThiS family protein [Luteolibacter sp.]
MNVTILAFAQARDTFGFSEKVVDCEPGETARELLRRVSPGISIENLRVALDSEFAEWDEAMGEVKELALLPPVSGG